ncbi:MAG: phosphatase PAP2 family protein [Candidatus Dormibacteraeota bacterium]|nr:phosphatase PAP2 family protein [Candidatus Dormibacteraeota bacterium]
MDVVTAEAARMPAIRRAPFVYAVIVADAAAIALFSLAAGGTFDWWLVALVAVAIAALLLPVPQWVSRWAPMLLIAVVFLALGGLSQRQGIHASSAFLIAADRALTGTVVPVWLQQHLSLFLGAPALALTAVYLAHYVAPLLTAGWLWWRHRERFDAFVATYLLAMVIGFAVYLTFPQAPPWLASQQGLVPHLHRSVIEVLQSLHLGSLYAGADPEPFGAMPSLHVTIPVLVAGVVMSAQRSRWRWLWLLYPAAVAFAVLVMAEHYLTDTLAGVAVALVAAALVSALPARALSGARDGGAELLRGRGDPEPA